MRSRLYRACASSLIFIICKKLKNLTNYTPFYDDCGQVVLFICRNVRPRRGRTLVASIINRQQRPRRGRTTNYEHTSIVAFVRPRRGRLTNYSSFLPTCDLAEVLLFIYFKDTTHIEQ